MGHYNCIRTTEEISRLEHQPRFWGAEQAEVGPAQHHANHMENKGSNWIRLVSDHTCAMKSLSSWSSGLSGHCGASAQPSRRL